MDKYQPDHYRLLAVSPRAEAAAIKASYRKLSRVFHPDRQGGSTLAEDCFKQIAAAYAELADDARRQQYDRMLLLRDPLRLVDDPRAERALDVLDHVVQRLRRKPPLLPGSGRGRDLRVQQKVDFARAMLGGPVEVEAEYDTLCRDCDGQGTTEPARNPTCHVCLGHGTVRVGLRRHEQTCGFCDGRGVVLLAPCATCAGKGTCAARQRVEVPLPARTRDGSYLRVRGAGERPGSGGEPGDLVVVVQVVPHPLLRADGDDLVCQVPLTWTQAVAGTHITVPSLEGPEQLTVPPGTPSGREFRIAGRGLPRSGGRGAEAPGVEARGALRLQILVDVPAGLSAAEADAVRALEHLLGPGRFVRAEAFAAAVDASRPAPA